MSTNYLNVKEDNQEKRHCILIFVNLPLRIQLMQTMLFSEILPFRHFSRQIQVWLKKINIKFLEHLCHKIPPEVLCDTLCSIFSVSRWALVLPFKTSEDLYERSSWSRDFIMGEASELLGSNTAPDLMAHPDFSSAGRCDVNVVATCMRLLMPVRCLATKI